MQVITIQKLTVLQTLKTKGVYYVSDDAPIAPNLIKPYNFMMKHYRYQHRPIFGCPVWKYCNFGGTDIEDSYIIELIIPDRYCKIQDYYCWSDFIYFTELPYEFEQFNGMNTVEEFGKYVLDMNKSGFKNRDACYQVTSQFLHKNWVRKVIKMNETFRKSYIDNGGNAILYSIM